MIYSLYPVLKPVALKVQYNDEPVSYDGGDINALHQWIVSMNSKQIASSLGIKGSRKYPLIWLVEGWQGEKVNPGIRFKGITFYVAKNTKPEILNEHRINNFEIIYKVANDFIKELKRLAIFEDEDITFFEKPNFSTEGKSGKESDSLDVWDAVIVKIKSLQITNQNKC